MGNSKIHEGLKEKELRDFLGKSLNDLFIMECNNVETPYFPYDKDNPFDSAIKRKEFMISQLENEIRILKHKVAINTIIKMKDWETFDVSDVTTRISNTQPYMCFIGTENEHNEFVESIGNKRYL